MTSASTPSIVVQGLCKHFPGVQALDDVSVAFQPGEVTAVMGENGAGKSTLMSILAGLQGPDRGTVTVDGVDVKTFTPSTLLDQHRVALVPQEIALCEDRTVAENVLLGREPGVLPSRRAMAKRTRELLEQVGTPIDPGRRAGSLPIAEQQLVLVARALARDCRTLILDEPTASLTPGECARLFELIGRLCAAGTSVVYVTHRIPEVFTLSHRVHVLRDGRLAASFVTKDVDPETVVLAMVGRELSERMTTRAPTERTVLRVEGLSGPGFDEVALTVRAGEILGIAGLPDSGRTELVSALFGATRSDGMVALDGARVRLRSPRDAIRAGIGYVPAERRAQGLFPDLNVAANLVVLDLPSTGRFGIVRRGRMMRLAEQQVSQLDVRASTRERMSKLSGGNQQKVVLGRWLHQRPRLLLLDEPTRGVDVGAKLEIHTRIGELAETGSAVVLSSSDLPELLRTCDRIVVMAHGRVVGALDGATATEERVMALATGLEREAA
jgi:ribose transport system ATP-binding protein